MKAFGTVKFWPAGLPSGGFAYGLSDVAVIRWLHPGEAFVTPRGRGVVDDGRGGRIVQDNFHWYYFTAWRDGAGIRVEKMSDATSRWNCDYSGSGWCAPVERAPAPKVVYADWYFRSCRNL